MRLKEREIIMDTKKTQPTPVESPEKTPERTPEVVPLDTGNYSGGGYQQYPRPNKPNEEGE